MVFLLSPEHIYSEAKIYRGGAPDCTHLSIYRIYHALQNYYRLAGVTQQKAWFRKGRVCSSLIFKRFHG